MKAEDIDNMQAGRELDMLVAEKVMGWRVSIPGAYAVYHSPEWKLAAPDYTEELPLFSVDIAAAWLVVEKMRELGKNLNLEAHSGQWRFHFNYTAAIASRIIIAEADTAPLAICRAALKAVASEQAEGAGK